LKKGFETKRIISVNIELIGIHVKYLFLKHKKKESVTLKYTTPVDKKKKQSEEKKMYK
jgi:hypothetical protein